MTDKRMTSIKAAITRFDNAAQEYAFKGSFHPDDREIAEQRYAVTREMLEKMIERMLKPNP